MSENKYYKSKNERVLIDIFDEWRHFQNIPFYFLSPKIKWNKEINKMNKFQQ